MKKLSLLLVVGLILTFSLSAVAGNWSTYITYDRGFEEYELFAGQYEPVGKVIIDGSGVTFEADGGYLFSELHLDVEDDYKDIPRAPGRFDYGEEFSNPVNDYTFQVNVEDGDAVAAHAVVVKDDGSGWEETAWAEDDQVGNYFDEDNKGKFRKSPIVLDVEGQQGLYPVLDRAELPDRVQVEVQYQNSANQPYFLLTIKDLSGNVLYNDVATWCIDLDTTIRSGITYEADVYGNRQSHRYVEKIAELFAYSNYDMGDIQVAIWVVKEGISTDTTGFGALGADQATVEEILDEVGYTNYS